MDIYSRAFARAQEVLAKARANVVASTPRAKRARTDSGYYGDGNDQVAGANIFRTVFLLLLRM